MSFSMNKENQASSSNHNRRHSSHFSGSTSSSGKKRPSLIKKMFGRQKSFDVKYKSLKKGLDDAEEDLGSNLLSSFSNSSEEPVLGNFVKSKTILQKFVDPETGEHTGFLKEVIPPKNEGETSRMTLFQRNVWEDGWLMAAHFTFKNYTESQTTVTLKFLHVHDNLEFLRSGEESVKVEANKRYVFSVGALESEDVQLVVRRKARTGNPKMLEISYRFGYKKNGRWNMTW